MKNILAAVLALFAASTAWAGGGYVSNPPGASGVAMDPASIVVGGSPKTLASGSVLTSSGPFAIYMRAADTYALKVSSPNATVYLWVDPSGRVGIGTSAPATGMLETYGSPGIILRGNQGNHGMTNQLPTDAYGAINRHSGSSGALSIVGASNASSQPGMIVDALIGHASPAAGIPAFKFRCGKANGAGSQNPGSSDTCFDIRNINSETQFLSILGSGNVGINNTAPTSLLHVSSGFITNNGNVSSFYGYGSAASSPYDFNLYSADAATLWQVRGPENSSDLLRFARAGVGNAGAFTNTGGVLRFGVGTTAPATVLHAVGTTGVRKSSSTTSQTHSTNLGAYDTAPASCVVGDEYTDVSGAKCFCDSANNWIEMGTGTGSCT